MSIHACDIHIHIHRSTLILGPLLLYYTVLAHKHTGSLLLTSPFHHPCAIHHDLLVSSPEAIGEAHNTERDMLDYVLQLQIQYNVHKLIE